MERDLQRQRTSDGEVQGQNPKVEQQRTDNRSGVPPYGRRLAGSNPLIESLCPEEQPLRLPHPALSLNPADISEVEDDEFDTSQDEHLLLGPSVTPARQHKTSEHRYHGD